LLTPLAKAVTGKQAVAVLSEVVEAFGGAGYVEDTGIPTLLRDAQVLPIWEGTTNVLALDLLLRADVAAGTQALRERFKSIAQQIDSMDLKHAFETAQSRLDDTLRVFAAATGPGAREAGARRFVLGLGQAYAGALLVEHAAQVADLADRAAAVAACLRFAGVSSA
jgi:acyl-CoA dehydrogenase